MAHFAKMENGKVVNVIVVHNNELLVDGIENEQKGKDFCNSLFGGEWIQTSYNRNFRKHFAGFNYTYDAVADVFIEPQPFPSWTLNSDYDWEPPVSRPEGASSWDEESLSWLPIPDAG